MKTIAFIPARGGSVSIPKKNIKLLNNKPLIYYAIDAANNCDKIDTIVISTDCDKIKEIVKQHPSKKIIIIDRSPEVSTNTSPTIDVVIEFSEQYDYETMVLIQATSPLTTHVDLSRGLEILNNGYDSCLSVVREHRFVWDEETLKPLHFTLPNKPRRQDWKGIIVENGAFYMNTKKNIMKDRFPVSGKIGFVEMHPYSALEIDTPEDWLLMESLFTEKHLDF
ncbi:MAG: cytidylyltransferase domain-containing protein [Brevinema sp.]